LGAAYLSIGWLQHQRAHDAIYATALLRGDTIEHLTVKPTMGNLLLWRSIYRSADVYHIDAVRVGLGEGGRIYPGAIVSAFDVSRDKPELSSSSVLYDDIQRFDLFSDGYLALHPNDQGLLGDVRYAILPTSAHPLWGIRLDLEHPERHAQFETYRQMSRQEINQFIDMLKGAD
jgi:inner membrane protein